MAVNIYNIKSSLKVLFVEDEADLSYSMLLYWSVTICWQSGHVPAKPEMELLSFSNLDGFKILKVLSDIILAIAPQSTLHFTWLAGPVQMPFLPVGYMST